MHAKQSENQNGEILNLRASSTVAYLGILSDAHLPGPQVTGSYLHDGILFN